tara:strand:+ start:3737 stop:4732 length:996 start_codon:yes stop_codon:yes gene_type:complete
MKQLEKMIREELLHVHDDVCVSIYVPPGTTKEKCDNIKDLVVQASDLLRDVFSTGEVESFIRPLASITKREAESFNCSIALFRSKNSFKILGLPISVEPQVFVSNHFNVKPLLEWLQKEQEFFCFEFSRQGVEFFGGDIQGFRSIKTLKNSPSTSELDQEIIQNSTDAEEAVTFVAGNLDKAQEFLKSSKLKNLNKSVVDRSLYSGDYSKLWQTLVERIRRSGVLKIEKALMEYNVALMNGRAESDVEAIISAAKEGKIKKLIISSEDKLWGRFDAYKNQVNRINKQTNYEDDDLLDSISEKVMEAGGQVVVANRKQMPKDKILLAIMKAA